MDHLLYAHRPKSFFSKSCGEIPVHHWQVLSGLGLGPVLALPCGPLRLEIRVVLVRVIVGELPKA